MRTVVNRFKTSSNKTQERLIVGSANDLHGDQNRDKESNQEFGIPGSWIGDERGSLPAEKSPTSAHWKKSSTEETPRSRAINHISKIIPAALRSGRLDRVPSAPRNSRVIGSQLYAQGV
ncbi:hypothetical protein WN51_02851 [Melipona quadrifasciata]|uniref:Uncharacterized protein n=1 Tax=Melipona quadrifasciata TaxID=166423 RepID=A0A0M9A8T8_9HYME|nr:hypothetical protein WN51_02851 [Melipona quadrifasciata]